MNQILYEEIPEKKQTDMGKVLKFFGIALVIFGLCLTGGGAYGFFNNRGKTPSTSTADKTKPTVTTNSSSEDKVRIYVIHSVGIEKVIYNWNNGEDQEILGQGRTQLEEFLTIPFGDNELNVKAIGKNGEETLYTQNYYLDSGVDIQKPTISIEKVGNNIKITAQDEREISFLTYRWNNEEETRVEEVDETGKVISIEVPVPRGENDITIIAVDKQNNSETKIQKFKAGTQPIIKVRQFGEDLTITVTDEVGVKRLEYTLNGKKERVQLNDGKTWEYTIKLTEGENDIIIEALNTTGIAAEIFHGRAVYTP